MKTVTNVGKRILSKDMRLSGIITSETERYCAVCKKKHRCYVIKWDNNTCTKPCERAVAELNDDEMIIV